MKKSKFKKFLKTLLTILFVILVISLSVSVFNFGLTYSPDNNVNTSKPNDSDTPEDNKVALTFGLLSESEGRSPISQLDGVSSRDSFAFKYNVGSNSNGTQITVSESLSKGDKFRVDTAFDQNSWLDKLSPSSTYRIYYTLSYDVSSEVIANEDDFSLKVRIFQVQSGADTINAPYVDLTALPDGCFSETAYLDFQSLSNNLNLLSYFIVDGNYSAGVTFTVYMSYEILV